jgi:hypothetical protein
MQIAVIVRGVAETSLVGGVLGLEHVDREARAGLKILLCQELASSAEATSCLAFGMSFAAMRLA